MFLEVMGRDVGHITLYAGIAGGADVILIPEIPYDPPLQLKFRPVARGVDPFYRCCGRGSASCRICVSGEAQRKQRLRQKAAAAIAMAALRGEVQSEMRSTVLGYLQRGGSPCAFDRVLATRLGARSNHTVRSM